MLLLLRLGRHHCGVSSQTGGWASGGPARAALLRPTDVRVLKRDSGLTLKDGAALGELGRLVRLVRELALGVGLGERAAVLNQFPEPALLSNASGLAAERLQLPSCTRLKSGTPRGRKASSREISEDIRRDQSLVHIGPFSSLLVLGRFLGPSH